MFVTTEYTFKVLVLGEANTGKSSIIQQLKQRTSDFNSRPIVGEEFLRKVRTVDGYDCNVRLWECSRQTEQPNMAGLFYKRSHGIVIVYDVTNRASFQAATAWYKQAADLITTGFECLLVGNKTDLVEQRMVSRVEGREFARKHRCDFSETSTQNNDALVWGFEQLVFYMAQTDCARIDSRHRPSTIRLVPPAIQRHIQCGCNS